MASLKVASDPFISHGLAETELKPPSLQRSYRILALGFIELLKHRFADTEHGATFVEPGGHGKHLVRWQLFEGALYLGDGAQWANRITTDFFRQSVAFKDFSGIPPQTREEPISSSRSAKTNPQSAICNPQFDKAQ